LSKKQRLAGLEAVEQYKRLLDLWKVTDAMKAIAFITDFGTVRREYS
jgi:hypothetical protein